MTDEEQREQTRAYWDLEIEQKMEEFVAACVDAGRSLDQVLSLVRESWGDRS